MSHVFLIAVVVFALSYVLIISEKVHRTVVALGGAALMICLGVLTQERAVEGVDFNTLGLLIGMMVIVDLTKHSGVFQYIALWTAKLAKGKPLRIYFLLGLLVAVFSAFLDNVTTVLLTVPIVFVIAHNLKLNPKPFLFNAILLSNIGGTATLIGDPPNILIGSAAGLSFNDFLWHLGPIVVVLFLVISAALLAIYRKDLVSTPEVEETIRQFKPKDVLTDIPLLVKSLTVLGLVVVGFLTHSMTHLEGATIALAGAALLLLITLHEPEAYLRDIEWATIFFFIGLFILVAGIEEVGVLDWLAQQVIHLTQNDLTLTTLSLLWVSGILSAIVDNIPFVATMIPLIQRIGELSGLAVGPLWWALALGADIGGNATIIGASANVMVSGMARKEGHAIGFIEYMKVAVPLTILALMICSVYMWVRYL